MPDAVPDLGNAGRTYLLAIDTAANQAGLALYDGAQVTELSWPAARAQTSSLLVATQQLLELTRLEPAAIGAIAVATGPGSFSGLRVGLGAAKGLAYGLDCPIIGVPTLAGAFAPYRHLGIPIVGVVAAGRDRIVWSLFAAGADMSPTPPRNSTVPEMLGAIIAQGPILVAGDLNRAQATAVTADARFVVPDSALRHRRPAGIAALGWSRWRAGDTDDLATLEPGYTSREEVAGRT